MKTYAKGYRAERELRKKFEKAGFIVIRSAGSKQLWDLVVIGRLGLRLIQVKNTRRGELPKKEMEKMAKMDEGLPLNVVQEIWIKEKNKWKRWVYERDFGEWKEEPTGL